MFDKEVNPSPLLAVKDWAFRGCPLLLRLNILTLNILLLCSMENMLIREWLGNDHIVFVIEGAFSLFQCHGLLFFYVFMQWTFFYLLWLFYGEVQWFRIWQSIALGVFQVPGELPTGDYQAVHRRTGCLVILHYILAGSTSWLASLLAGWALTADVF